MPASERTLIIDSDEKTLQTILDGLKQVGDEALVARTENEALQMLDSEEIDLAFFDLGIGGLSFLKYLSESHPEIGVVVTSAAGKIQNPVEIMRLGAVDYLPSSFTAEAVSRTVSRIRKRRTLVEQPDLHYANHLELARHYASECNFKMALHHVKQAIPIDPSRPEAFNLLGAFSEIHSKPVDAQKLYRVALELDSSYAPAQRNLDRLVLGRKGHVDLG